MEMEFASLKLAKESQDKTVLGGAAAVAVATDLNSAAHLLVPYAAMPFSIMARITIGIVAATLSDLCWNDDVEDVVEARTMNSLIQANFKKRKESYSRVSGCMVATFCMTFFEGISGWPGAVAGCGLYAATRLIRRLANGAVGV